MLHKLDREKAYECKPCFLPEIRALTTHLEVCPTLLLILLGRFGIRKLVILVVSIEQVCNDGARLLLSAFY